MNKPGVWEHLPYFIVVHFYLTLQYCLWFCCLMHFIILKCIISWVWQNTWHCGVHRKRKLHLSAGVVISVLRTCTAKWVHPWVGPRDGVWGSPPVPQVQGILPMFSEQHRSLRKKSSLPLLPYNHFWDVDGIIKRGGAVFRLLVFTNPNIFTYLFTLLYMKVHCWSWLAPACKSWFCVSLPSS